MKTKKIAVWLAVAFAVSLGSYWLWSDESTEPADGEWVAITVEGMLNSPASVRGSVRDDVWQDFETLHDERVRFGKFVAASVHHAQRKNSSKSSFEFLVDIGRRTLKGNVTIRYVDGDPQISTIRFYPSLNALR